MIGELLPARINHCLWNEQRERQSERERIISPSVTQRKKYMKMGRES